MCSCRSAIDGERGPEHERLAVLHHDGGHLVAGREARGVRRGDQRHGGGEGDREAGLGIGKNEEEGGDRQLRPALSPLRRPANDRSPTPTRHGLAAPRPAPHRRHSPLLATPRFSSFRSCRLNYFI